MTERPILFSGPMVRAILESRKTQTRRVVKGVEECPHGYDAVRKVDGAELQLAGGSRVTCPHGAVGDRLWVRENGWQRPDRSPRMMRDGADTWKRYYYDADISAADHEQFKEWGFKRRPSIHMPRWACRLVLEVTGVRAERLDALTEGDAFREGIERAADGRAKCEQRAGYIHESAVAAYRCLWDSLNAKRGFGWAVNPFVWVISFRRLP